MKLHTIVLPVLLFGAGYAGGVKFIAPLPELQEVQVWSKCCETPGGTPCSAAKNKYECYLACQAKCGDPDSLVGKKCRQFCNIRWA